MSAARLLAIVSSAAIFGSSITCHAPAQKTVTYVAHYLEPFPGPQAYKDVRSGTLLYLETDGRHVAAISSEGKLLWNREPHKDASVPTYRTDNPQIYYVGKPSRSLSGYLAPENPDQFAVITFTNSQFGVLRISNGEFKFLGQD
jgi:hypothetical protein